MSQINCQGQFEVFVPGVGQEAPRTEPEGTYRPAPIEQPRAGTPRPPGAFLGKGRRQPTGNPRASLVLGWGRLGKNRVI